MIPICTENCTKPINTKGYLLLKQPAQKVGTRLIRCSYKMDKLHLYLVLSHFILYSNKIHEIRSSFFIF